MAFVEQNSTNLSPSLLGLTSYYLNDFWDEYGDPRVKNLPLMGGGPWATMAIIASYLYFVKILGPSFMKDREPFQMRPLMALYNSYLVGVNGVGFIVGLFISDFGRITWSCTPNDPTATDIKSMAMIYLGYCYYLSKFVDFLDTIFFVLRKKYHQASFLHVFHHGVMPFMCFLVLKLYPSHQAGFLPILNTFIHAIMYSYYALASAGPEMRRHLWWKKYITQIQMLQFSLTILHSIHSIYVPNCWPWILATLQGLHATFFLVLFYNFYRRSYREDKKVK